MKKLCKYCKDKANTVFKHTKKQLNIPIYPIKTTITIKIKKHEYLCNECYEIAKHILNS